jgi:3-hydroxyisobutyrate dehydrogenase-like beta-hydroxyacid dehydrogenase
MKAYGFIGLGSQGAPIARRMIEAGLPVSLWARRPATLAPFAGSGATLVDDLDVFAEAVDYVGICVVDDNGVQEVCRRLIPGLRRGSTVVIHSTVSPVLCETLAETAAEAGVHLLDAPVSGGSPAAEAGKLTVMVGGDTQVCDAVGHVFNTFANLVVHLGDVGAGQHAKLVNNSLMAANMGLAYHALVAANALGLKREAFTHLINASSGRSFGFEVCARLPEPAAFRHGASLLAKDVALLGDALGEKESFRAIESAARTFLDCALAAAETNHGG